MKSLRDFFDRYSKIIDSGLSSKVAIVESLKKTLNIDLEPSQIEIKKNKLIINTSSAIKATIYINKQKILEDLKLNLKDLSIVDVC